MIAAIIYPTHCVRNRLKSDDSRAYQPFTYYFCMSETSGLMEQRPYVYVVHCSNRLFDPLNSMT